MQHKREHLAPKQITHTVHLNYNTRSAINSALYAQARINVRYKLRKWKPHLSLQAQAGHKADNL